MEGREEGREVSSFCDLRKKKKARMRCISAELEDNVY
jgi:hypothetical protein